MDLVPTSPGAAPAFDEPLNVAQPVLCRLDLIHKDIVVQVGARPEWVSPSAGKRCHPPAHSG